MKFEIFYDRNLNKIQRIPVYKGNLVEAMYSKKWGIILREYFAKYKYFSLIYGKYLDTSHSKKLIRPFINDFNIQMEDFIEPENGYRSFNEFFYRKLSSNSRPVDKNVNSFVSPCDSRMMAFEGIDSKLRIKIKGNTFSLNGLTNSDCSEYEGGSVLIFRLTPLDYHRFHFPISGIPEKSFQAGKYYYTVNPISLLNKINVFLENKRENTFIHSPQIGTYIYSEIGAVGVGGIHQTFVPGKAINKGDEKGFFSFGASTVILIVRKNKIKIDEDIIINSSNSIETRVLMGEKVGVVL